MYCTWRSQFYKRYTVNVRMYVLHLLWNTEAPRLPMTKIINYAYLYAIWKLHVTVIPLVNKVGRPVSVIINRWMSISLKTQSWLHEWWRCEMKDVFLSKDEYSSERVINESPMTNGTESRRHGDRVRSMCGMGRLFRTGFLSVWGVRFKGINEEMIYFQQNKIQ